ncbi:MAG: class I SAM-dependent methyltransferase [Elusimicrobiota bacterium]|nr:class I SAM-dependent methyltransferase [Endomicrobiia bacterium]MDW8166531.1 class I SAM-dependent methyltransferase [Elusimicrobiota bacterium]
MKEIFDTYIENAFGDYKQAEFKFRQFEINYRKWFPSDKNANLLDIGIGRGEMLKCFEDWGYTNYIGIDISQDCVNFCKSLGLKCKLVNDATDFLLENAESYDLITIIDVLEHIPRERVIPFLKAVHKALKEGGIAIIQVPNLAAPEGYLHHFNDFTHYVGYNEHSLRQVLIASGFRNIHFQKFEEITSLSFKSVVRKLLRYFYWHYVKFLRRISGNLQQDILTPVFSAIVKK